MDFFEVLQSIMAPNKDNGSVFTNTERLARIDALLWNSKYRRVNHTGLYCLYAARPLCQIQKPILVSSHVDCVMNQFFTREYGEGQIQGTYDNCITNAAIVYLMLEGQLPDHVLVAFTGDEEADATGAANLVRDLSAKGLEPHFTVVLDVTDMGWEENAHFTVENNFWEYRLGEDIIRAVQTQRKPWRFVPEDVCEIPGYVDPGCVIHEEAEEDESWQYDEFAWNCFSLCLPIKGNMHSNAGVLARKSACMSYLAVLKHILSSVI